MTILALFAGHNTVRGIDSQRGLIETNDQIDTNGEVLLRNRFKFDATTGATFDLPNIELGVPLNTTSTWFKTQLTSCASSSGGASMVLRAEDSTEIFKLHNYNWGGPYCSWDLVFFGTVLHSKIIDRQAVSRSWDFEISIDDQYLATIHRYDSTILTQTYTLQLTQEQAELIPHNVTLTSHDTGSQITYIREIIVSQTEPTLPLKVKLVELGSNGTHQDFGGDVTDINSIDAPNSLSISTSVAGSKATYNTVALSELAKDYRVKAVVVGTLASAGVGSLNQLQHIISDGVSTLNLGQVDNIQDNHGYIPSIAIARTNPLTGVEFTMDDVDTLEFGFEVSDEV